MCTRVSVCVCWGHGAEIRTESLPLLSETHHLKQSLWLGLEPANTATAVACGLCRSSDFPFSSAQLIEGRQSLCPGFIFITWIWDTQTQVLLVVLKAFYQLSHLSSSRFMFKWLSIYNLPPKKCWTRNIHQKDRSGKWGANLYRGGGGDF